MGNIVVRGLSLMSTHYLTSSKRCHEQKCPSVNCCGPTHW